MIKQPIDGYLVAVAASKIYPGDTLINIYGNVWSAIRDVTLPDGIDVDTYKFMWYGQVGRYE